MRAQRLQLAGDAGDTQALNQSEPAVGAHEIVMRRLDPRIHILGIESTEDREAIAKKRWTAPKSGSPDFGTSNAQVG
jgi:hypothetical protein